MSVFAKSRLRMAMRRAVISLRGKAKLATVMARRTGINRKKRKTQPKWRTRY